MGLSLYSETPLRQLLIQPISFCKNLFPIIVTVHAVKHMPDIAPIDVNFDGPNGDDLGFGHLGLDGITGRIQFISFLDLVSGNPG